MTNTSTLLPCPFCKKPPGTKVGPPAMARCITGAGERPARQRSPGIRLSELRRYDVAVERDDQAGRD